MWELGYDEKTGFVNPRIFRTPKGFVNKCSVCGKPFDANDKYYIIMPSNVPDARDADIHNGPVHVSCWEYMCDGITTDDELITKLKNYKPSEVSITHLYEMRGKAFQTVMQLYDADCSDLVRGEMKANSKANKLRLGSLLLRGEYIYFAFSNKLLYIPPDKEVTYYVSDDAGCDNDMLLEIHNKIRDVLCEPRLSFDLK